VLGNVACFAGLSNPERSRLASVVEYRLLEVGRGGDVD